MMGLFLIAIAAVALLVLGLSITLMRKGHHIQSEVGDNPNMRALGLDCALKDHHVHSTCDAPSCGTCTEPSECKKL